MPSYIIMTAIGPDRPGLVDEVSAFLETEDLNIESSRMAVLGGEFAMIVMASGEKDVTKPLLADLSALEEKTGLQIFARPAEGPDRRAAEQSIPYVIRASGMDHRGIVHEISKLLHDHNINIEAMDTWIEPAPVSGTPVFAMEGEVSVPTSIKIRRLRRALEDLADDLNVDIEFEAET